MNATVQIEHVSKHFGTTQVLNDISLTIAQGEFLTLLGPSGSGKTTLLQVLAGFVRPSSGSVKFDGREMLLAPPHKRNIGIVFQSYALFPHMSVAQNVAYPLRIRGVAAADRERRVAQALDVVQLGHLGDRAITQLSGGQRQRVALARAIVFEPQILLMDEPLSALDKKLREQMQIELRSLHKRLGMTTILVTHDQREALSLSDRIGIIDRGKLVQLADPIEIYERPSTRFVADFMGDTSFIPLGRTGDGALTLQGRALVGGQQQTPLTVSHVLVVRPERLRPLDGGDGADNRIDAIIHDAAFQGDSILVLASLDDGTEISARVSPDRWRQRTFSNGQPISFGLDRNDVIVVADV